MKNTIVTYETFHGSAKKIAEIISKKLGCKYINIDTPFEAEDLREINTIVFVFNFRGPYTAQLTKLYMSRVREQLKTKNVILVGEGLFSQMEFPVVAEEIHTDNPSKTFNKFFVNGQLRVATLFPEERALLQKFSELTGMEIKDMGELDLKKAEEVAVEIENLVNSEEFNDISAMEAENGAGKDETQYVCPLCGYTCSGDNLPEKCPLCGVAGTSFLKA